MTRLEPGMAAPDFTLLNHDSSTVSLADHAGSRVILYFYPEAMTPGCTQQACDFRDSLSSLAASGLQVIGVSRDSVERLRRFAERDGLTFPLLSDESLEVHRAYDTFGEKNSYGRIVEGVRRSTFVIGADGVIEHAFYNTKAKGHVEMLRKRLHFA